MLPNRQRTVFTPGQALSPLWKSFIKGSGSLDLSGSTLRLGHGPTTADRYSNAQIDDYQGLARRDFLWRPPLRLTVRARFSHPAHQLQGTGGFGFWNDPFLMTGLRRPALPRAVWFFFSSPPSNMKLDIHTPGYGWKAATLDAVGWLFFALLPTAPLAVPLMNVGQLYRTFWPVGQRAIKVSEALVPVNMSHWHTYDLCWQRQTVQFTVDSFPVLTCDTSPGGPLGFVLWLDNQYMIVTPWGSLGYGLIAGDQSQWLEISRLDIEMG